jgi:hypothetical protein
VTKRKFVGRLALGLAILLASLYVLAILATTGHQ